MHDNKATRSRLLAALMKADMLVEALIHNPSESSDVQAALAAYNELHVCQFPCFRCGEES